MLINSPNISGSLRVSGNTVITGSLTTSIAALGTPATTFLTSNNGTIRSRTAAQTLSDIGGQASGSYVTSATDETLTGVKTFTQDIFVNSRRIGRGSGNISSNTVVGNSALRDNTTGSENSAFGGGALRQITTGAANTSIGFGSMLNSETGAGNTAIGNATLAGNNGSNNIAVGNSAGRYIAGGTTVNSTCLNSVYLGANTRPSLDGNTNEIVIGSTAIGNGSNSVTIGNSSITENYFTGNVRSTALRIAGSGSADPTFFKNTSGTSATIPNHNLLGFNNSNDIFVTTELNGGFILAFNNSTSNKTYTLQDADGTLAFTSQIPTVAGAYLPLTGGTITGSLTVTGQVIAQTLNVQEVTSSIVFSSGSNIFGNNSGNTQQFTGSVSVTGSLAVAGAGSFSGTGYFGGATVSSGLTGASELIVQNELGIQNGDTTGPYLRMVMGGVNQNITLVAGAFTGTEPNLLFSIGGATRLTVSSTGTATFDTTAAISAAFNSTNASGGYIGFRRSGTSIGYLGNSAQLGQGVLNALELRADNNLFLTTTSGLLTMTSGGNVGIGTASVSGTYEKLAVAGGISIKDNTNAKLEIGRYNTSGAQNSYIKLGANSNSLRFTNNTDVADIMELTNSGDLNVTGTVAMSSPFIFRNKIINGAMTIDQRNGGAAITTDGGYPVDRFVIYTGGSANLTNQRSTTVPTGFRNSLSVTVGTGVNTSSGDYVTIRHGIEGLNIYDLAWGTASAKSITLSFWVRSSLTGNFGVALRNNANNYGYVASYNIPLANTWTYITTTIPGPTSGTWNTDNTLGIRVIWDLGVGTSYSIAAGAWTSQSEILGLTGGVKLKATTGATFNITGIQFEAGNIATPFEHRPTSIEELLCKRYYEKEVFTGGTYYVAPVAGIQTYATISYKAEKRTDPQVALPQVSTASDTSNRNPVSNGVHRGSWYGTLGGTLTNNVNSFTFTAECEL
jgi:hypothetical protein